ncbi:MAG: fadR 3 [Actinoallomurus sp.]|nr:fadR 3 [Actinoallomurus sp.]
MFEERGFLDAKISEICERAGVAYGSFYTHFADKDAIFAELIDEMLGTLLSVMRAEPLHGDGPEARIARANRAYLRAYRDNAGLMAVFEQVATFSPAMRRTYLRAWGVFYDRQEHAIRGWQEAGLVPPDVDPRTAAVALATMIGRTAYTWFVLGRPHDDGDVEQLTRLYCRAIGI